MSTLDVNGVDLYYERRGTGRLLVLTHGSWTDGSGWSRAVDVLSERFDVVTWDRRGHSRSGSGTGPGSRDEDADDLAALIEHVGSGPVLVVGNSYGAVVTMALSIRHPELVDGIAVHEPPLLDLLRASRDQAVLDAQALVDKEIAAVLALIEAGKHRDAAETFMDRVALGPGSWVELPESLQQTVERNAPTFLDEERDPTSRSIDIGALAELDVPMLLTCGTHSPPMFRAIIDELAGHLPRARTEVIPGAGHIPHASHPVQWGAIVADFLEAAGPRGPR